MVLTTEQQDKIWLLIEDWALNQATESEKITMREKLRTTVYPQELKGILIELRLRSWESRYI